MDVAVAFGKVIRELRIDAGLTQEQLGFEADLRRTFVSLLELGQQQPSLMTIFKLAPPLCATPSEIIKRVEVHVSTSEAPTQKKPSGASAKKNGKQVQRVKSARK
jgi:transcriptional regulator with XRE-family HTH domain